MKKTILFASAALAALSFTSCSNEVDPFESIGQERATLDVNITNDDAMLTRGDVDYSKWWVKVGTYDWVAADKVKDESYPTNTYNVVVGNYKSLSDAMRNEDAGNAYYTKEKSVTLNTGANSETFDCGTAQNARLSVDWSAAASNADITITSVVVRQYNDPTITEPDEAKLLRIYTYDTNGLAYFYAGHKAFCTINYLYKNASKPAITKVLTAFSAATEYKFKINANTNGTITTLTITYNDTFADGGEVGTTVIDAATGNEYTGN